MARARPALVLVRTAAVLVLVSVLLAPVRAFQPEERLQYGHYSHRLRHHREHVKELTCGKLYYRTFHMDEHRDVLYVGAMDRVLMIGLPDISQTDCDKNSLVLEATSSNDCMSKGKNQHYDCRNHIRVIQPMGDGSRLYVCGTNAHNPKDLVIYANLTSLPRTEFVAGVGNGIAKCPFDPDDNSTAVWVEHGNPGGLAGLYSGTVAEFTKADNVIFRTDLYDTVTKRKKYLFKRTIKYDSKWLDKPNFVASYDIGEYVYFFFRETALEYINCGKAIYSRVARVCKKDTGGKNILTQNWATYVKARLNCSIPGEFPFYFNEIQSVYKVPGDDTRFYAVFTTSMTGLMGSAICTFSLADIQDAFAGKFKEQKTSSSAWLPVSNSAVPEPRPGQCVNDTQTLPDMVLTFIQSHPLVDQAVSHQRNQPVFYRRDLVFTHLVVDKVTSGTFGSDREYTVYYAGSNDGQVYKIVEWTADDRSAVRSELLDVFHVTAPEPVRRMAISRRHKSLYVSSDTGLRQLHLEMCNGRADSCLRCVRDPYCGWEKDSRTCRPYVPGLLQDVTGSQTGICDSSVPRRKVAATWGQALHLGCNVKLPEQRSHQPIDWYLWNKERGRHRLEPSPSKYVPTVGGGVVVLSATEQDAGRYEARLGEDLLCVYTVTVDTHRCSAPDKSQEYQKVYADWCNQFEKYKSAMKAWEKKQAQCRGQNRGVNQNSHSNDIHQQPPPPPI
ncbi:semaphorin-2A-like [Amphibalanus amphitrite]|uniref:semaphorin-2A-like n=1 Tax=Amphibalanus amphitrite TaxID=1232801 RepID=UPI001C914EF2|nr:semaphorin-2A-like [Amphibalanus amphitrite]XP_043240677.1 semaphorin-2A-like [Amphibalanus amphitrite]